MLPWCNGRRRGRGAALMENENASTSMTKRDSESWAQLRSAIRSYAQFSDETVREYGLAPHRTRSRAGGRRAHRPRPATRPDHWPPAAGPGPPPARKGLARGLNVGRRRHSTRVARKIIDGRRVLAFHTYPDGAFPAVHDWTATARDGQGSSRGRYCAMQVGKSHVDLCRDRWRPRFASCRRPVGARNGTRL